MRMKGQTMKANRETKSSCVTSYDEKCLLMSVLLLPLLLLIGFPSSALATKHRPSKAVIGADTYRPSAAVAKETKQVTVRFNSRRIHGVNALNRRGVRRTPGGRNVRSVSSHLQALDPSRIRVLDGGTFAYDTQIVRIQGLTASNGFGSGVREARQQIEELLHQGQVMMLPKYTDQSGHLVAEVYIDSQNILERLYRQR